MHKPRILTAPIVALAGLLVAGSVLIPVEELPGANLCAFRLTTGLPCPFCGVTHGIWSIGHGDFRAAWAYNPLAFVVFALAVAIVAVGLIARRRTEIDVWLARVLRRGSVALGLVLLLTMFEVWRITGALWPGNP